MIVNDACFTVSVGMIQRMSCSVDDSLSRETRACKLFAIVQYAQGRNLEFTPSLRCAAVPLVSLVLSPNASCHLT